MRVLFICKGNWFRSQIAAAIYNKLTGTSDAISAGTYVGAPEEPEGLHMHWIHDSEFFQAMEAHGLYFREEQSRKLTHELLASADLVVSMAEEPFIPDFLRADERVLRWNDVPNPQVTPPELRERIYEQILALVQNLINTTLHA